MPKATIGIDCRLGGSRHGGIGRYIAEYVSRAVSHDSYNFALVFSDEQQQREILENVSLAQTSNIHSLTANIRHYSLAEQLQLPAIFNQLNADILHVPHFNVPLGYRGPLVVTIHDLLWHSTKGTDVTTLPAWQYWPKYAAYQFTVNQTVHRARRIFAPTQFVADTIASHYQSARSKLAVTYEGVSEQFTPSASALRNKNSLLYVGSLYPHKNVSVILDALKKLPNMSLIIVGARDVFSEQFETVIKKHGLENRVDMRGKVNDKTLIQLYQTCGATIQPSTSEGFGLTGVEALACNSPLIASDIPVFHEVYGKAAEFFDPQSAAELAQTIERCTSPEYQADTAARTDALSRCSWDRMTNTILAEISSVV